MKKTGRKSEGEGSIQGPGVGTLPCPAAPPPGEAEGAPAASTGGTQGAGAREDTGKATAKDWSCHRPRLCLECYSTRVDSLTLYLLVSLSFLVMIFKTQIAFSKAPPPHDPVPSHPILIYKHKDGSSQGASLLCEVHGVQGDAGCRLFLVAT